ncbi:CotH kinase family protein [Oscillospiraceae bacterium OttesenSCG-928-F05]|nr:CotH kinase family protein [Oscillospiraceae bacterium OttesenSCG-928-F05]
MRLLSVFLISACLLLPLALGGILSAVHRPPAYNAYAEPLSPAPRVEEPLRGLRVTENGAFLADGGFSSHLPVVILDTGDVRPPVSTHLLGEEDRYVAIEGLDPYVAGSLRILDSGGLNRLGDEAAVVTPMRLKRRGNSSMFHEKGHYLLKTVTESGGDRMLPLLGMAPEAEWVLNGSNADSSLMRNYLAYRIAAQVISFTPNAKYCEVLYHENGAYHYEGVYLLTESIRQGEGRIDIPDYKSTDPFPPYIVRRDRYDENALILNTYATENALSVKYLGLIYPNPRVATAETVDYVASDLSRIERVLYAESYSVFSTYPQYIDVDSFVDYFLINEFLGSYDAGWHSTYMYKSPGGKLKIGPVWDFDNALDNYVDEPLDVDVTAFQTRPWFDRLTRDLTFLRRLEQRYAELRSGPLSDESFIAMVGAVEAHLGPAVSREWFRWEHVYASDEAYKAVWQDDWGTVSIHLSMAPYIDGAGDVITRDTDEYRQELYRLKTSITRHGNAIGPRLELLRLSTTVRTGIHGRMELLLFIVLLAFSIPVLRATRK